MRRILLLLAIGCLYGCAGESTPKTNEFGEREIPIEVRPGNSGTPDLTNAAIELMPTDAGEREVPGTTSDEPSGSPDLNDPRIDTSVMPVDPPSRSETP